MRKKKLYVHLILALGFYAVAISMSLVMPQLKKGEYVWAPPPLEIKHFTLGHNDTMADSFWIRLLQDLGVCEQKKRGNAFDQHGVRRGKNRTPECQFGWGYHMLNLITEIAPRFHLAASLGPLTLSVIADDIEGATALFDKALKLYPNDWLLHYQAGYHHLLELEDKESALKLFERASVLGGPKWLPLLIARLHTDLGRETVAVTILKGVLGKVNDEKIRHRAENKLSELLKKEKGD